jgi:uncharacterized cupredoxin-like copper-binding protein
MDLHEQTHPLTSRCFTSTPILAGTINSFLAWRKNRSRAVRLPDFSSSAFVPTSGSFLTPPPAASVDTFDMKTKLYVSLAIAAALSAATAEEKKTDKTLGERTANTLEKAGERAKDAGRAIADGAKGAGRTLADTTKKAADTVVDAVTPDKDAHRVEVTLNERRIDMPRSLGSGKTAFVVRNASKEKHNFEIAGQGIDKKFTTSLSPDESKVLHVDLAPGNYKVICPVKDHDEEGMRFDVTVK